MPKKSLSLDSDDVEIWNREDAEEFRSPAGLERYEVAISSRDWTVQTILSQIEQEHIDLDPAFQRRNAWRDHRRSRLIESFLLNFPVPQLVLAEDPRRRGKFIVIDGKQRLLTIASTYLAEYRGYWTQPKFSGLGVLTELNGVSLDAFLGDSQYTTLRRQLGNADIRTTLITGFRDEDALYDIFFRINTGSVPLSSQELRQVLNRGQFSKYLLGVTSIPNPLWDALRIDEPDSRLRDVELLLRLIALQRFPYMYRGNMKLFLDDAMTSLNQDWSTERPVIETLVASIFDAIEVACKIFGKDVGRKYKNGRYEGVLNRALFEVQTYYFFDPNVRTSALKHVSQIRVATKELFINNRFMASIESTTKSIENYQIRFSAYHQLLQEVLGISIPQIRLSN